ncbi:hypothetical protein FALBO_16180 [Fusarium albosuccineum]|uniref:Uncharacterized protein n=1 Tax=Fusarium albosuccineum TaxID=1237068 RepID=A0A8H4KML6_9HYPO|nr:hypothetical protein FALBO_16180 [Fusarium albosuccineum]
MSVNGNTNHITNGDTSHATNGDTNHTTNGDPISITHTIRFNCILDIDRFKEALDNIYGEDNYRLRYPVGNGNVTVTVTVEEPANLVEKLQEYGVVDMSLVFN